MDARHLDPDADVLIAGAGPAGCAAAIVCASAGLRTVLVERLAGPVDRPGEALHPGAETLLARLLPGGFADAVRGRHEGIVVGWGAGPRFEPFGRDGNGPWRGFQVDRRRLGALLLERAREVGADVRLGCRVREPVVAGGAVTGVRLGRTDPPLRCRTVIDATGGARWLGRALGLTAAPRSPRLLVRYGYAVGSCPERDAAPAITADRGGWTWTARVGRGRYQWMRLGFVPDQGRVPGGPPQEFAGLSPEGPARSADVSWRLCPRAAGPGWFVAGDAGALLDPAASHGVLRALLSGWTAGSLAAGVAHREVAEEEAAGMYGRWLREGAERDMAELSARYAELGARGFG